MTNQPKGEGGTRARLSSALLNSPDSGDVNAKLMEQALRKSARSGRKETTSLMRNRTLFCNNALSFVQARLSPMKSHSTMAGGFSVDARPRTLPIVATAGFLNLV